MYHMMYTLKLNIVKYHMTLKRSIVQYHLSLIIYAYLTIWTQRVKQ
jgi:hypothetical protein